MRKKFDMLELFNANWWYQLWHGIDEYYPAEVYPTKNDDLYAESGTRGVFVGGDPGTGKTRYIAGQYYKRFKENPKTAIFVFDWSGGITNTLLDLISRDPDHENLLKRVVLNEYGGDEYVPATPEFH